MTRQVQNACMYLPNHQLIEYEFPPRSHLPRFLKGRGIQNYEPISLAAFLASADLRTGAVLDIGANIGIFANSVAATLKRSVFAFEPFAPAANILSEIAHRYDLPVKVIKMALSDQFGHSDFFISAKSDMSNSLNGSFRAHAAIEKIPVITIDLVSSLVGDIAVCKIDTESTELQVLAGARQAIEASRPNIILEIIDGIEAREIFRYFEYYGYRAYKLGENSFIRRLNCPNHLDYEGDKRNWLFSSLSDEERLLDDMSRWLSVLGTLPIAEQ
jgi:FkbM family methyltransferase